MGWGGGTDVMTELIDALVETGVFADQRRAIYRRMLKTLTDLDWDNVCECFSIDDEFEKAVQDECPDWLPDPDADNDYGVRW
jgi:hypothetical protein